MASGNRLAEWGWGSNEPPTTLPAEFDVRGDDHPVWDFDAGQSERTVYSAVLGNHYSGGGFTVTIHYAMSSAVSPATVRFDGEVERIGDEVQDIDSESFAAAQSVTDTVPVVNGHTGVATILMADGAEIDNLVVGEEFRFRLTRDHDHADDDAAGDLEVKKVVINEQ